MTDITDDYVIIWEAPKIERPEFRLYYKKDGSVDFYTSEKPEGTFIVVDQQTYAEGRYDIKVQDGRIVRHRPSTNVQKYAKGQKGNLTSQLTSAEDISIVLDNETDLAFDYWELKTYEY